MAEYVNFGRTGLKVFANLPGLHDVWKTTGAPGEVERAARRHFVGAERGGRASHSCGRLWTWGSTSSIRQMS